MRSRLPSSWRTNSSTSCDPSPQSDCNGAFSFRHESVLERVGDKLVDDEADRDRTFDRELRFIALDADVRFLRPHRLRQRPAECMGNLQTSLASGSEDCRAIWHCCIMPSDNDCD